MICFVLSLNLLNIFGPLTVTLLSHNFSLSTPSPGFFSVSEKSTPHSNFIKQFNQALFLSFMSSVTKFYLESSVWKWPRLFTLLEFSSGIPSKIPALTSFYSPLLYFSVYSLPIYPVIMSCFFLPGSIWFHFIF